MDCPLKNLFLFFPCFYKPPLRQHLAANSLRPSLKWSIAIFDKNRFDDGHQFSPFAAGCELKFRALNADHELFWQYPLRSCARTSSQAPTKESRRCQPTPYGIVATRATSLRSSNRRTRTLAAFIDESRCWA